MKVKECMCKNVCSCGPETKVEDVARLMAQKHIGCIPICENDDKLVGIVTDRDIILRNVACRKNASDTKISEIMTCNASSCDCNSDLSEAIGLMENLQIRRIPITENGKLVGILTLGDIAKNKKIQNNLVGQTIEYICKCNDKNAE